MSWRMRAVWPNIRYTLGCLQIYRVRLHCDALLRMCKALHDALWSMLEGVLKLSVYAAFSEA